jgi:hypothetical protein
MSSKPRGNEITQPRAISPQAQMGEISVEKSALDQNIRRRAYEIYLERGEQPNRELDDWFQAEDELRRGMLARAQAG